MSINIVSREKKTSSAKKRGILRKQKAYLLDAKLLDRGCDDVAYHATVLVQLDGKHVFQCEGLRVHVKASSGSFHEVSPVSVEKNGPYV